AIPETELNAADQLTVHALTDEVNGELAQIDAHLEEWNVDPLNGPHLEFMNIESYQPVRSFAEAQAMVKRWRAMGPYFDQTVANWKVGLAHGKVATIESVKKVVGNC